MTYDILVDMAMRRYLLLYEQYIMRWAVDREQRVVRT